MVTVDQDQRQSPPYVAFPTFKNFISSLKTGVIPSRIDKSVMPGLSGGVQSHLLHALRALDLIGPTGTPTAELEQLVQAADTDTWPDVIGSLVRTSYADITLDIDLNTATPKQLDEAFEADKAGSLVGSTRDKAVRFFLSAVRDAKIDHGKRLVQRKARSGGTKRGRPRASSNANTVENEDNDHHDTVEMMTMPIHFKGKPAGKITVPKSITPDDCKMVKLAVQMVEAYATASENSPDAE